uniref:Gelsolin-like domain-containing protein n=1 Tax=Syphacia muris TaxID=451379 RepID=A0A0N5AEE7_9BILA
MKLFRYLEGGTPTGFFHVEELYKDWKPKLWRCKGKRNVRCTEVKFEFNSLNSGDVFILDCGLTLYVWMPLDSGRLERIKGMAQAKSIRDVERAGRPTIHIIDSDWDTSEEFWYYFGGCSKVSQLKPPEADGIDENFWRDNRRDVTLWKVSDESGRLNTTLVSKGNFKKDQLDSMDAFILDAANGGVYVWIGKKCTKNERLHAMELGTKFIEQKHKSKHTRVIRVLEGAEPASFTQWSSAWYDAKKTQQFQPKLYQCSNESGRLLVEEISNFTQEDLDGDDVMIVDALNVIYVWIGTGANVEEKKHAQETAKATKIIFSKYLNTDSLPRTQEAIVETIYQGEETSTFKNLFPKWNDMLWELNVRSYENMRKLMFS